MATPNFGTLPTYDIVASDDGTDTLHVDDHGLTTGDVVVYDNNGQTAVGGLEAAIVSGLPAPNDKFYREYNVIATGEDTLSFGAIFTGVSDIDPDTDIITFASPHNLETGERVFYSPGVDENGNPVGVVPGLTANTLYYVLVLDGNRLKLTTYDPLAVFPVRSFTPDETDDFITLTNHNFATGTAVTPATATGVVAGDDLSLLPADSEMVLGLNFAQLQQSALWKQFAPKLMDKMSKGLNDFKAACGFDPMEAVKSVTMGLKGVGNDQPDGAVVVHGLDKAKSMACLAVASRA